MVDQSAESGDSKGLARLQRQGRRGSPNLTPHEASATLRRARRALDGVPGYRLLDDIPWQSEARRWFLRCRLTVDVANGLLPPATDWCVLMEDRDPGGCVSVYPAADSGITQAFPNQLHNNPLEGSRPWRTGKICTTTPERILGRLGQSEEPFPLEDRLVWHVQRALYWIILASEGTLRENGDPYELPDFPGGNSSRFVFSEDGGPFHVLRHGGHRSGLARLRRLRLASEDVLVLDQFETNKGNSLRHIARGTAIAQAPLLPADTAKWVLLDSVPPVGPWPVAITFGELRRAMEDQGLSFDDLVLPLPDCLRDGRSHLLLVGFPIPEVVGGDPVQLH